MDPASSWHTDYAIKVQRIRCEPYPHYLHERRGKNLLKNDEIKLEYSDKTSSRTFTAAREEGRHAEVFFDQNSKASAIEDGWDFESAEIDDPEDKKLLRLGRRQRD